MHNQFNFLSPLTSRLLHCGIVYANGNNASEEILKQYKAQRDRGTRGFGFVTIGEQAQRQRFTEEQDTMFALGATNAKEILFHHRYPTSTANVEFCNHPIANSKDYKHNYYLVHNGIIHNAQELHAKHTRDNLHYDTEHKVTRVTEFTDFGFRKSDMEDDGFNDSETLLHELALVLEGRKDKLDTKGSIAFILLQTDKDDKPLKLYFGRNHSSPLKFKRTSELFMIASELEGDEVKVDTLYTLDYATNEITESPLQICGGIVGKIGLYDDEDDEDDEYGEITISDDEVIKFLAHANDKYMATDWQGLTSLKKEVDSLMKKHAKTEDQIVQWEYAEDRIDEMLEILAKPD